MRLPDHKKSVPSFLQRVKPLYIGIAAVFIVLFIAAIVAFSVGGSSTGRNHMIYVRDKEFQISYLSDTKPFQITDRFADRSINMEAEDYLRVSSYILMSENDRYVFIRTVILRIV